MDEDLSRHLSQIREQGLYRELRQIESPQSRHIQVSGKTFLNFSSNDYLGLANEPCLKEAAIKAVEKYGVGSGASRLICGSIAPHPDLEQALADFKKCEAALSFSSGYAAAVGTICALLGKGDVIIIDKLVHACIVDAARLSGAKLRVFAHNDLDELETILKWASELQAAKTSGKHRTLVVTESVFSMDGDFAPLREMVELKNKHGAWLMVDEAHGTGVYGPNRRGLAEELGVSEQIEIQMGTMGKAIGAAGGYIAGSQTLVEFLINRARSFIFSTAPLPAASAAATAGIQFIQSEMGKARRSLLLNRIAELNSKLRIQNPKLPQAIIPIVIGDETKTVEAASQLRVQGIFIPAIRYPTVAKGEARLRVTLTASHTAADVDQLVSALQPILNSKIET